MWKQRLVTVAWCLLGAGAVVLLAAAMQLKDRRVCSDVRIEIDGIDNHVFVDEKELMGEMNKNGQVVGRQLSQIPLRTLEARLEQNIWIRDAELFFDNNSVLHARIQERQPLARIFTTDGSSFYIDSSAMRLPLSPSYSAAVPMFTSFPSSRKVLSGPDSAVLQDVKRIALTIAADSFWMAQVAQVDITAERKYEIIPVIGNQVIKLGNAEDLQSKFQKLFSFYRNVWAKTGFEKYSVINAEYADQIVAVKRDAVMPPSDSSKARDIFVSNIARSGNVVKDSMAGLKLPGAVAGNTPDVETLEPGNRVQRNAPAEKPPVKARKTRDITTQKEERQPKAVMPRLH